MMSTSRIARLAYIRFDFDLMPTASFHLFVVLVSVRMNERTIRNSRARGLCLQPFPIQKGSAARVFPRKTKRPKLRFELWDVVEQPSPEVHSKTI
jgi:hypothetical protein